MTTTNLPRRPVDISQVGDRFVGEQTMSQWQVGSPALLRALGSAKAAALCRGTGHVTFAYTHMYSQKGSRAVRKRTLDRQIQDCCDGLSPETNAESYLKELIKRGSGHEVGKGEPGRLQFYIIRGGAEGFLPSKQAGDAEHFFKTSLTTHKVLRDTKFDMTDLLVVFDSAGGLVNAAQLERPIFVSGLWSIGSAETVYNTWRDKQPLDVRIRYNTSYSIRYVGLHVVDGLWHKDPKTKEGHGIWVDIHKREQTNGCIMIASPETPEMSEIPTAAQEEARSRIEPQFIKDVLNQFGLTITDHKDINKRENPVGTMRMVDIM